jgi:hypothetical protein
MCIICNMPDFKDDIASTFLEAFERSCREMKAAAAAMLECSKVANTPEAKARYDATHKEMVRQIREWNKLEEKREHEPRASGQ